jgi:hypothetical protein
MKTLSPKIMSSEKEEVEEYSIVNISFNYIEYRNKDGVLHREDGPARICITDGWKAWFKNGFCHRDNNLPAIIDPINKVSIYYTDGKRIREENF